MKKTLALIAAFGLITSPALAIEAANSAKDDVVKKVEEEAMRIHTEQAEKAAPVAEAEAKAEAAGDAVKEKAMKAEEAAKAAPAAGEMAEEANEEVEGHDAH
ncbi:MAG: hypothetical protein ACN2B6_02455 [Rickettsiales bacterium]